LFQKHALSTDAAIVQRVIKGNAPFEKPAKTIDYWLLVNKKLATDFADWAGLLRNQREIRFTRYEIRGRRPVRGYFSGQPQWADK